MERERERMKQYTHCVIAFPFYNILLHHLQVDKLTHTRTFHRQIFSKTSVLTFNDPFFPYKTFRHQKHFFSHKSPFPVQGLLPKAKAELSSETYRHKPSFTLTPVTHPCLSHTLSLSLSSCLCLSLSCMHTTHCHTRNNLMQKATKRVDDNISTTFSSVLVDYL